MRVEMRAAGSRTHRVGHPLHAVHAVGIILADEDDLVARLPPDVTQQVQELSREMLVNEQEAHGAVLSPNRRHSPS